MSLLYEYINKKLSPVDLETELKNLIVKYNKEKNSYLYIYAAAINKNIPDVSINMDDYFIINDMLRDVKSNTLDFYIETPGGSGETVEEIADCLHNKFDNISFVISGEAKSAGTILVLSGNEIYMTETGSLGPVDAQIRIGRGVISAYDYKKWVEEKISEANKFGKLNPFDAVMIAQISPGEIKGVYNALDFAKDLIKEWLPKYKFKNWNITETQKQPVNEDTKVKRAEVIADELVKHDKYRSHGRSLKRSELEEYLKIHRIEDNPVLCDIVNRIHTILRLLFQSTSTYKVFASADEKIFRNAVPQSQTLPIIPPKVPDIVEVEVKCPQCGNRYEVYGKFKNDKKIDDNMKKTKKLSITENTRIKCVCGFVIDLMGLKNDIENKINKKFV